MLHEQFGGGLGLVSAEIVLPDVLALARADGYGDALLSEDGGDLQVPAERLDVGAQRGEVDVAAALQP